MSVQPVRWGILGAANIATSKVIPAMQRGAFADVVAIASRDKSKAGAAARTLGIPRAYGSYDELLDDPGVEAIYNPLPNHLHVPWTIRAAEKGKHVLCEKPIALSAAEARALIEVRNRTGVQIAEAFMVRTHPQWIKVKELARSGRIGDLRLVHGHFSYSRRDPNDVRSRLEWGGGAMLDIGCYPVTMSRWLFGEEPTAVVAEIERDPELKIDRLASAILRFPSGQATLSCAGQLVLHQGMQIFGTKGRIALELPFNPPLDRDARITVDDGRDLAGTGVEHIVIAPVNQYTLQADQFSLAVRGAGTVAVPLEDAIANMAVLDALFRSGESRSWETP